MSGKQQEIVRGELYLCPCCTRQFFAKVTYDEGGKNALYAFQLALCDHCKRPCCPYCDYIGGEQVICTRCTNYPDCKHISANPQQELCQRLYRARGKTRRIEIRWNASDGGPRMDVKLLTSAGDALDEWNDWVILSHGGGVDDRAIKEIIMATSGEHAIISSEVGAYFANFEVR